MLIDIFNRNLLFVTPSRKMHYGIRLLKKKNGIHWSCCEEKVWQRHSCAWNHPRWTQSVHEEDKTSSSFSFSPRRGRSWVTNIDCKSHARKPEDWYDEFEITSSKETQIGAKLNSSVGGSSLFNLSDDGGLSATQTKTENKTEDWEWYDSRSTLSGVSTHRSDTLRSHQGRK